MMQEIIPETVRKITEPEQLDISLLRRSWRGRSMYACYKAYGLDYPFCQFYQLPKSGILLIFNQTAYLVFPENRNNSNINMHMHINSVNPVLDTLALFLSMYQPFRIECDEPFRTQLAALLPEYQSLHRTTFQLHAGEDTCSDFHHNSDFDTLVNLQPPLEQVYQILQAGFPHLQEYALWLTDTSHRCRHGISRVMLYNHTTTASILSDIDNHVLIGQVATLPEARGLGHARIFLRWLAGWLETLDKTAVLYALDIRESFYREIGFTPVEEEYVLERKEPEQGTQETQKGLLENA